MFEDAFRQNRWLPIQMGYKPPPKRFNFEHRRFDLEALTHDEIESQPGIRKPTRVLLHNLKYTPSYLSRIQRYQEALKISPHPDSSTFRILHDIGLRIHKEDLSLARMPLKDMYMDDLELDDALFYGSLELSNEQLKTLIIFRSTIKGNLVTSNQQELKHPYRFQETSSEVGNTRYLIQDAYLAGSIKFEGLRARRVELRNVEVDGDVDMSDLKADEIRIISAYIKGKLLLTRSQARRILLYKISTHDIDMADCSAATISIHSPNFVKSIDLRGAHIGIFDGSWIPRGITILR